MWRASRSFCARTFCPSPWCNCRMRRAGRRARRRPPPHHTGYTPCSRGPPITAACRPEQQSTRRSRARSSSTCSQTPAPPNEKVAGKLVPLTRGPPVVILRRRHQLGLGAHLQARRRTCPPKTSPRAPPARGWQLHRRLSCVFLRAWCSQPGFRRREAVGSPGGGITQDLVPCGVVPLGSAELNEMTFHLFRKSRWYGTEGLQHHKTPFRCPWTHQSCTNSSPGPCTPCGTNPCNLVYIWGRPNRQRRNAAPTRDRGDGSQTACTPRVRILYTPNATITNQGRSEC